MEPIPLIPATNSVSCPDTSHILREEFQDFLGNHKFLEKIAENLREFNSDELQLKSFGSEVVSSYRDMRKNAQEFTHAERLVMTAQAEYLTQKLQKDASEPGTAFKLNQLYPDIDPKIVQKYYLIQAEDILPHITERIISCKMKPQDFIFENACLESKRDVRKLAKLECLGPRKKHKKYNLKVPITQDSRIAKIGLYRKRRNQEKKQFKKDFSNTQVFVAEPDQIVFSNFDKDIVYEENLRLRNITTSPQVFKAPHLSKYTKFRVKQHGDQYSIAPGMSVSFTVSFFVDNLSDSHEDVIVFNVPGSKCVCVQLMSWRNVPIVRGLVYDEDEGLFDEIKEVQEKDDVYNYTIDCGAVMYGCSKDMKLIVQNNGGNGLFFLLSEEDWVSGEVNNITEDFTLQLEDFSVTPAYFELKENEINEILINFTPKQYGLCLDKVFFLCDSNTIEEIDIIGDCLFYEPYYLQFRMPDCPFPPFKQPREPRNVLHLGAVYVSQMKSGVFTIYNTSMLTFSYEWRRNKYSKVKDFIPIENDCIEINPGEGIITGASETEFEVTVAMKSTKIGLYKYAFSLYLLDILEKNLSEGPIYTFGEEYSNETFEKCLTILVDNLEVQIHNVPLQINVYPEEITFPTLLYNVESCPKIVRVVNSGYCCLFCEWIHCKDCGCHDGSESQIQFSPAAFDLEASGFLNCSISVLPVSYEDIQETFFLSVNRGYRGQTLSVRAVVEKPHIQVSPSFFDLGSQIKRNSEVRGVMYVENNSISKLFWRMLEYRYVFDTNSFEEVFPSGLESDCGMLCHQGSGTLLEYNLDTSISRKFMTILVFYTIYNDKLYESSHVILVANIIQPEVRILTENYKEDIFSIQEEYYVNETITRTFYIHNDSPIEIGYSWGEPTGEHCPKISIKLDAWSGRLYPWSRRSVNVTLVFVEPGIVHDVYIQLGVEALPDPEPPLCLHICCVIKPPQVLFSIPSDPTCRTQRYVDVFWPTYQSIHTTEIHMPPEDTEATEPQESIPVNEWETEEKQIINMMPDKPEAEELNQHLHRFPDDIFSYLENIQMPGEEEYHYPSAASITPCEDVNTAEIASERTTCAQLTSVFGSNTSLYEYFIEFRDIQCRQVYKKSFEITNIMEIPIKYSITLKNFKGNDFHRKKLDQILININWKPDDTYTLQLSKYGIVVIITPESGDIQNKSSITIELQVYAETWGFYLEEVGIEVDNLPIFYVNIFIQVIGLPVEFPSNTESKNIVRFGNRTICSPSETRTIYLRNTCTIPYTVVWHMFVKDIDDFLKGSINIAYDIFGFETEDESVQLKVLVTPYFGKESSLKFNLFKISPHEIHMKPNETKSVKVTLNPHYFKNATDSDSLNIEGVLIGHIYINDQFRVIRKESNFVLRNPEKELDPIKIHITAGFEPSEIDLNCIRGHRNVFITVSDFLKEPNGVSENLTLVFRNTAPFTVVIGVNIDPPFKVVAVKSAASQSNTPDANKMFCAAIYADSCAQVVLQCDIDTELLMMIADVLYKNITHYLEDLDFNEHNRAKITKKLRIYQECNIKQELPLTVHIAFPLTVVSTDAIQFGHVRFGTIKTMSLKLLNKTNSLTWFNTELTGTHVFEVTPSKGYLYPTSLNNYSKYLTVTFTPKDICKYEEILTVITCVSQYRQEVKLTGTGTYNEKYLCEIVPK